MIGVLHQILFYLGLNIHRKEPIMKTKEEFTIRIDSELYKKLIFVASKENNNLNNHMLHMIRQNVQYFEKVHGRINTQNIELPEKSDT